MMLSLMLCLAFTAAFLNLEFAVGTPVVSRGSLQLRNLFISNPYESEVTSSYNSTLSVIVLDGDHPDLKPVNCLIEWKAGVGPPRTSQHQCENTTTRAWFPDGTFRGVEDFQIQLSRTVIDISLGECPQYCYLTKYASINMTYPGTMNWECDNETAVCQQELNSTIQVSVYLAVAELES